MKHALPLPLCVLPGPGEQQPCRQVRQCMALPAAASISYQNVLAPPIGTCECRGCERCCVWSARGCSLRLPVTPQPWTLSNWWSFHNRFLAIFGSSWWASQLWAGGFEIAITIHHLTSSNLHFHRIWGGDYASTLMNHKDPHLIHSCCLHPYKVEALEAIPSWVYF